MTIGKAFGRVYAFVGLERIGGIVAYDINDPRQPFISAYSNPRNFNVDPEETGVGDLGPEGIIFIKAEDSPNGQPLLVVGNEVSGTTTVFEVRKLNSKD